MSDSCIETTGIHLDKDGYPRLKWQKRIHRMNRLMWTFVYGDIPDGMCVCHSCNNKGCINTNHMYLASSAQNSADAAKDGLYRSGTANGRAKITPEEALKIKDLYHAEGLSQQMIGTMIGVSQSRVSAIIRGEYNP